MWRHRKREKVETVCADAEIGESVGDKQRNGGEGEAKTSLLHLLHTRMNSRSGSVCGSG
jgi:hypothetical protein